MVVKVENNKKYIFNWDNSVVIVLQSHDKRQKAEVSRDLENKKNPFWVNYSELKNC